VAWRSRELGGWACTACIPPDERWAQQPIGSSATPEGRSKGGGRGRGLGGGGGGGGELHTVTEPPRCRLQGEAPNNWVWQWSGTVQIDQLSACNNIRNLKKYSYLQSLAGRILYRVHTHRIRIEFWVMLFDHMN